MEDRTPDFMLEEYKQIAHGYEDLHSQQNELIKFYLTLVAIPASVLAVATQLVRVDASGQTALMGTVTGLGVPILVFLMVGLSLVGLGVVLALVATRAEALLYVRTVNCVRRYFIEKDPTGNVKRYLVLPDFDTSPPYLEGPATRAYWSVAIVAVTNSSVAAATFYSILWWWASTVKWLEWGGSVVSWEVWMGQVGLLLSLLFWFFWCFLQLVLRHQLLTQAENGYRVHFPVPFPIERHLGVDLDGVLGDLAGTVIEKSRVMFGLHIRRCDITSHRLEDCTELSSEQVKQIFQSSDAFRTMRPVFGAVEAIKLLRRKGWVVHVITDRFWGHDDWKTAKSWLEQNGFEWDSVDLVRAEDKPEYARSLHIPTFIEDRYDTAQSLANTCEHVFLLDAPYNQGSLGNNVERVFRWPDITKRIEELAGKRGR